MGLTASLLCMTMTLYHEARGEPIGGQFAVGMVILNRVQSEDYPNTICDVITEENQFTFEWEPPKDDHAWSRSAQIASQLLNGKLDDVTKGALCYARHDSKRAWKCADNPLLIGSHRFWY